MWEWHPHPKACRVVQTIRGLRVLVVGDLTLELPVKVEATGAELTDFLKGCRVGPPPTWKMGRLRVGVAPVFNRCPSPVGNRCHTVETDASDKTSPRRGVAAATGQVAGLDLPTSFEELDAE